MISPQSITRASSRHPWWTASRSPLVVVGGGPAGVAAALAARAKGAEVTVIERSYPGGTCVHAGCIPSAVLHRAAHAKRLHMCDLALSPRAIAIDDSGGAFKLVVDDDTGAILGAHMIGPYAIEVIAQSTAAMHAQLDYRPLAAIFHVHPSMAEVVAQAVRLGSVDPAD